MMNWKGVKWDW